jgi:hypothetical protein
MKMTNERKLIEIAMQMQSKINDIKDFYPDLLDNLCVKKLLSISENWDKMLNKFISPSKEGGI